MPDTNIKDHDPKRLFSTPDNRKDRSGSYDEGQDFDPTEGFDHYPDDVATTELSEDRVLAEADEAFDDDDDLDDDLEDEELEDEFDDEFDDEDLEDEELEDEDE